MCGIAGFLTSGPPADSFLLKRMCDRLIHRGPDDEGYYVQGPVGLGFRRLSIIDVARGHQPLGNEDGSIQIVFNGEIYNYRELREGLLKRGHRFATHSDTEVMVHLYEEVGDRLPGLLNGMFAFAIWDGRKRQLFLARDRAGKKPLYYSTSIPGYQVCFASELKALMAMPGFPTAVDPKSVADFLALSYVPDWTSIHQGVSKVPAGHSLTVDANGAHLKRYWRPEFAVRPRSTESAVEEVRDLARDAVQRRMIADVPLGAFLSGGVDSSAVVGMMSQSATEPVKTFSMGFTAKEFDELQFAGLTARMHATDHHEEVVTPSMHEALDDVFTQFDEPFGDSSAIPMMYLSRMTRRHVTVALSGDGADEIFGGYRRYYYGALEQRVRSRVPASLRSVVFQTAGRVYPKFDFLPQVFRAKSLLTNLAQETGDAYFNSMSVFRDTWLRRILSPELRAALSDYAPRQQFRERFQQVSHLSALEQMQAIDFETYLPGDILVKTDRTTMLHSLEARCPWLDHRLIELAGTLPPGLKLRGRQGKHIFRKAVAPYVPSGTLTRRKMGFSVPLAEWLRSSLRTTFEDTVLQPAMSEYLSLEEVRRLWSEHQSGWHNHDRKLWNLLMLAGWHARYQSAGAMRAEKVMA